MLIKNFPMQLNKTFSLNIYSGTSLLRYTLVGSGFLNPYIANPPFFKFCPTSPLLFLLPCFFDWMSDCTTSDVLFFTSWHHGSTHVDPWHLRTLQCVFLCNKASVYWVLTHDMVFCWYSDLVSHTHLHTLTQTHTHKDTQHTQGSIDWHIHINICYYNLLFAQTSHLYYTGMNN